MYDSGSVSAQNDTLTMPSFSLLEPPQPQGIRDTLYLQAPPGSATALALAQVASSAPLLVITPNTASAQRLAAASGAVNLPPQPMVRVLGRRREQARQRVSDTLDLL